MPISTSGPREKNEIINYGGPEVKGQGHKAKNRFGGLSFIHSFIHSLIHSLTHSLTHSFIHSNYIK